MDIGFEQIKEMTVGEVLKLTEDKKRIEKEMPEMSR